MTGVADQAWFRDPALGRIFALLNADSGEGRVVGGAVRNSLMDLPVSDVDIATTLRPEAVIERAAAAGIKAVPTGLQHGTVTLVIRRADEPKGGETMKLQLATLKPVEGK